MAILTQEQYFNTIKTLIGDSTSDETLKTLEDLSDTYNDLYGRVGEDWKAKHDALDTAWRQRYRDRFFHGEPTQTSPMNPGDNITPVQNNATASIAEPNLAQVPMSAALSDPQAPENIGIDDLFTNVE